MACLLLAVATGAFGAAPPTGVELEARLDRLAAQLRCQVCDNQTIADSDAKLARDMKAVVREQLAAGRSEEQVIAFLRQRYGDYVLYKPPLRPGTWALWFGPFVLLGAGLLLLWRALNRQKGEHA
ncbi:cytochrome c-type biogenesis protein [Massilia eburnea]|uniref:cytochrome c-type biogenesis protein n=1 Tax=Massilia eburnea TaxID=1776165 RepID=UPI003D6B27EF